MPQPVGKPALDFLELRFHGGVEVSPGGLKHGRAAPEAVICDDLDASQVAHLVQMPPDDFGILGTHPNTVDLAILQLGERRLHHAQNRLRVDA